MNSTVPEEFLIDLPACAAKCVTTTLLHATPCSVTQQKCICTNKPLLTDAIGCFSLQCPPKLSLSSTNITRAACGMPEKSETDLAPALAGSLGTLALIMVILRWSQRMFMKKSLGRDDGLLLMALDCAAPLNCLTFPLKTHGLGTNVWTIPFDNITVQLKLLFLAEVFYMPSETLTQLSFLAFYLRIFPPSKYQYMAYALGVVSMCFGISNTLVIIFQCTPVSFVWTKWVGETAGSCIDINSYSWYRAAMQIVMDLSIIALPLWPLSKLSLSKRKKTLVLVMFCTGFLITVVSCLRLQSLIKFSKSANISMDNNPAIFWSVVECDVAIICACLPCLPSLLQPCFPGCFGSTRQYPKAENRTPSTVRMEHFKRREDFSILHTSASRDGLVSEQ
ncbi:hypothetical protein FE257_011784 [Aspergillus nanangensis]|uniref:CFEM domain-containing protein n=1 Tax=Aspergillus nanangensis TaxID=2582783 RepID=A0AAD4GXV9_ASPNN|nr:hypothetical protein FE257_011784 [Aspergillus nanangensis]